VRKTFVTPLNRINGVAPFVVGVCIDSLALNVEFIDIGFV